MLWRYRSGGIVLHRVDTFFGRGLFTPQYLISLLENLLCLVYFGVTLLLYVITIFSDCMFTA